MRVRDHIPLQQGLRLKCIDLVNRCHNVRDHIPLQQGLRPFAVLLLEGILLKVRDHIPLQQGLRLIPSLSVKEVSRQRPYSITTRIKTCHWHLLWRNYKVRDHIPLQQGLRLLTIT